MHPREVIDPLKRLHLEQELRVDRAVEPVNVPLGVVGLAPGDLHVDHLRNVSEHFILGKLQVEHQLREENLTARALVEHLVLRDVLGQDLRLVALLVLKLGVNILEL